MSQFFKYKSTVGLILLSAVLLLIITHVGETVELFTSLWHAIYPLILGLCIAFVMHIIVEGVEKLYFPRSSHSFVIKTRRPFSILTAFILVVFTLGFVLWMVVPQTVHSLTLAVTSLPQVYTQAYEYLSDLVMQFSPASVGIVTNNLSEESIMANISAYGLAWISKFASKLSTAVNVVFDWFVGLFFAIYILVNKESLNWELTELFTAYVAEEKRARFYHVLEVLRTTFSQFFIGQFLDSMVLGLMVGIGMAVFQLPYAVNIACVIGITALIPILGAYIGGSIGIIMLFVESPWQAGIFLVILVVMQQIEGNFIYPKLVGSSVGLPGIWVFATVILGGNLFGVLGMLLGVPLGAAFYKLVQEDVSRRLYHKGEDE